ncbi:RNA polymerase sigma factor [Phosphitispora fastidiosa]|uniref:RNA polymerase sigma factor n=1 Tax=Phosphitispora fastidiosa TaxID=2837202 RepID=UPI001E49C183|nr:sigma-70 family RNA polymerase sigma factor [Phosphitispora fastidiosa]MBU7007256.1 RNA polymerase sigma-70 factor (ECF subfamily) [Phosphitispora fastidiosa]
MDDLDELLIKKIIAGDSGSFEKLVSRYQKKIFAFVYRMVESREDAGDLTQEVFLQVFRSLNTFRGDAKLNTWLYRIASNKTLDFLRKNKKTRLVAFDSEDYQGEPSLTCSPEANPEQIVLKEEKMRRLRRLIAGLPDRYRLALVLYHYQELTYQQIAETLDIPVKTVATRLYRAKLILRETLRGDTDAMS